MISHKVSGFRAQFSVLPTCHVLSRFQPEKGTEHFHGKKKKVTRTPELLLQFFER